MRMVLAMAAALALTCAGTARAEDSTLLKAFRANCLASSATSGAITTRARTAGFAQPSAAALARLGIDGFPDGVDAVSLEKGGRTLFLITVPDIAMMGAAMPGPVTAGQVCILMASPAPEGLDAELHAGFPTLPAGFAPGLYAMELLANGHASVTPDQLRQAALAGHIRFVTKAPPIDGWSGLMVFTPMLKAEP